jgi:O-methyltransferase
MSTPANHLRDLLLSFRISRAIAAVTELGIADLLANGPWSVEDLAAAVSADKQALHRVLRLLASEGVFTEIEDGRFALTPMANALRSDVPDSIRPMVRFISGEASWRSWGNLLHSVRTGTPAFDAVHGVGFFEYLQHHPEEQALFDELMTWYTRPASRGVANAYDFSPFSTVVDVGGGQGGLMLGLLETYPNLRGIVFDQPTVASAAREAIRGAGLEERCEAISGDFFADVPRGGDVYMLKSILHDWDDEQSRTILRVCRGAMPLGAPLLVIEMLIPPGNEPSFAKSQDVNMLVNLGGRERSESEYRALFEGASFDLGRTILVQDEQHIIEAIAR